MALAKGQLIVDILDLMQLLATYDGETAGQTQFNAMNDFANGMADAIDDYIKSGSIFATPVNIGLAVMTAGGVPVVAANNLDSEIQ